MRSHLTTSFGYVSCYIARRGLRTPTFPWISLENVDVSPAQATAFRSRHRDGYNHFPLSRKECELWQQ